MVADSGTRLPVDERPRLQFAGLMAVPPGRCHYRLPDLWSLLLIDYRTRVTLGAEVFEAEPGTVLFVEPDVAKDYLNSTRGSHYVVHFRAPLPPVHSVRLRQAFDPGVLAGAVQDRIQTVVRAFPDQLDRAEIALWDLLHLLGDLAGVNAQEDVITELTRHIDAGLHTHLTVGDLVVGTGYSHGHLLELFRLRHGTSIVGYIRRRRMDQARHLLSTDMPVASIAAQIGIPDLQAFNKAIRQQFGYGPRELRRRLMATGLRTPPPRDPRRQIDREARRRAPSRPDGPPGLGPEASLGR